MQQPITLPPGDEPEPDVAIVRGTASEFRTRHPRASEVVCLFEVADSSLQRDRTTKLQIYAENSIPTYIIVNLINSVVEIYTRPIPAEGRYDDLVTHGRGYNFPISLPDGTTLNLAADQILA